MSHKPQKQDRKQRNLKNDLQFPQRNGPKLPTGKYSESPPTPPINRKKRVENEQRLAENLQKGSEISMIPVFR